MKGLVTGATYPLKALNLFLRKPHLRSYFIIPILVNLFVGIVLYLGIGIPAWYGIADLTTFLSNSLDSLIANLPSWLGFVSYFAIILGWLLNLILLLGLFLLTGFLLLQFGGILGAPWYGQLSEQVEKLRTGQVEVVEVGIVRDIGRAILFELKKLLLMLIVGAGLLLLNFLPVIGSLLGTIGGFGLAATLVCLDFLDGPSERRRFPFRQKLKIVLGNFPATASFSVVCLGLISIPFINLLTIPICVAGGTLFWFDLHKVARR